MARIGVRAAVCVMTLSVITAAGVTDDLRTSDVRVRFVTRGGGAGVRVEGRKLRLNRVSGAELRAIVPVRSLSVGNSDLNERVRKKLDVERCPEAVFAFDPRRISLRPAERALDYKAVNGELTLRCDSHPATAFYKVSREQGQLRVTGVIRFDSKQYGIEDCLSGSCGSVQGNIGFAFTIGSSSQ